MATDSRVKVDVAACTEVLKQCFMAYSDDGHGRKTFDTASRPFPTKELLKVKDQLVHNILLDHSWLYAVIPRHIHAIEKRWSKKGKTKRQEVLKKAWPAKMPAMHRPDDEEYWTRWCKKTASATKRQKRSDKGLSGKPPVLQCPYDEPDWGFENPGSSFLEVALWPYINLEDLTPPKSLLIFLNSRGREHPHKFAMSELNFCGYAQVDDTLLNERWPGATMNLSNSDSPGAYGSVTEHVGSATLPTGFGEANCHAGKGFVVLSIQYRIYGFLRQFCELVLHDIPKDKLISGEVPQDPVPVSPLGFKMPNINLQNWQLLFDVARMEHLVSVLYENAKEHVWLIREDPSYFVNAVKEIVDHQVGLIPDENGNTFQVPTEVTLRDFVVESYKKLVLIDQLHGQLQLLNQLSKRLPEGIDLDDLSMEHLSALLTAHVVLREIQMGLKDTVMKDFAASPVLRPLLSRTASADGDHITVRSSLYKEEVGCRVFGLVRKIASGNLDSVVMYTTLDVIAKLYHTEPRLRSWLTPLTERVLEDLTAITECLFLFRLQPWGTILEVPHNKDNHSFSNSTLIPDAEWIMNLTNDFAGNVDFNLENFFLSEKFFYPADQKRNQWTVNSMCDAEKKLDTFWESVDRCYISATGSEYTGAVGRILASGGSMRRTAPWNESEEGSANQKQGDFATPSSFPAEKVEYGDLAPAFRHNPEKDITGNFDRLASPRKEKHKRRSSVLPPPANLEELVGPPEDDPVEQPEVFRLDKRSCAVMKVLFHSQDTDAIVHEIRWRDFVSAMTKVGFEPQHVWGSSWRFVPGPGLDYTRGISFHEPHPDPKFPIWLARRIGRRLEKAFGWHGDMVKQKDARVD